MRTFAGLIVPPGTLRTGAGTPYSVFSQFARVFHAKRLIGRPLLAPRELPALPQDIRATETAIPTCEELGIERNSPVRFIHRPWEASDAVLGSAGIRLRREYPHPVIEHHFARGRFLAVATKHLKRGGVDAAAGTVP